MDQSLNYHHHEDEYFLKQNTKLREALREKANERAKAVESKQRLADATGVDDEQVLTRLHELGIEANEAKVLHLVPLVEVAWADGAVQSRERHAILEAASRHGAEPDSEASSYLAALLETKPDQRYFDQVRDLVKALLKAKGLQPATLAEMAQQVAGAAGGLFGLTNPVDQEEQAILDRLQGVFGDQDEAKQLLNE